MGIKQLIRLSALKVLFFVFLLASFYRSIAQINTSIPSWVKPASINEISNDKKKLVKDGYYYLLVDEQYNELTKQRFFHYAVCALTEEALVNVSQIEFSYDPAYEKGYLHSVVIHRGGQVIDKIKDINLKELNEEHERKSGILNGEKTLYANLSDVRKGDVIEYSYSYTGKNPILGDYFSHEFLLSYTVPVGRIFERIIFPLGIVPSIVYKNTQFKPAIDKTDCNDYTWEISTPEVVNVERGTPSWYNPNASVQISNLKSWEEVKIHCEKLFNIPFYDERGIKNVVDSIINSSKNVERQITAVIEFVQTHIRYSGDESGIYSHIPRSPEYVLKNRYGDCKEKSVLLNVMLKMIGVEAYPVLVNTILRKEVQARVPSVTIFNHCISMFAYKNRLYFVDPTISCQRGHFKDRIIPPYELGMVLDGKATKPFIRIPTDEVSSKCDILEDYSIEPSGDVKLRTTSTYTGNLADEMRMAFLTNSIIDIQESYKRFYSRYTDDIEIVDTLSYSDNGSSNMFVTTECYLLKKYWDFTDSINSRNMVKEFVPFSLLTRIQFGDENKRKDPLLINYPLNYHHTMTIYNYDWWNVTDNTVEEENQFFSYSFKTEGNNSRTLMLTYDFKTKTDVIDPGDYKEYKAKMDFVDKHIVFSAQESRPADGTFGFNWLLTLTMVAAVVCSFFVIRYIYKQPFSSSYDMRYTLIGGWLILLAIGIVLSPISLLFELFLHYSREMRIDYAVFYFDEKSPYFSPMKGYLSLFLNFSSVFFAAFSILNIILFFQRKALFRYVYPRYMLVMTGFLILNLVVLHYEYGDSNRLEDKASISTATTALFRFLVAVCIWVPYILVSERSKHTFTQENKKKSAISSASSLENEDTFDEKNE